MDERPVLTQTEVLVLHTLRRECRRRRAPTTIPQLAAAVELSPAHVGLVLRRLRERNLVVHVGERSGYLPATMIDEIRQRQGVAVSA